MVNPADGGARDAYTRMVSNPANNAPVVNTERIEPRDTSSREAPPAADHAETARTARADTANISREAVAMSTSNSDYQPPSPPSPPLPAPQETQKLIIDIIA